MASQDDLSRRLAEILEERDPARFDAKIDALVDEIVAENPDGPDFYTIKTRVMKSVSRMFDILDEEE